MVYYIKFNYKIVIRFIKNKIIAYQTIYIPDGQLFPVSHIYDILYEHGTSAQPLNDADSSVYIIIHKPW